MSSISLQVPFKNSQLNLRQLLKTWSSQCEFVGLRWSHEKTHYRMLRDNKPEMNYVESSQGVMIEAMFEGHMGYAGTSEISPQGLQKAFDSALSQARFFSQIAVVKFAASVRPPSQGEYRSPRKIDLDQLSLAEVYSRLGQLSQAMKVSDKIVKTEAYVRFVETDTHYLNSNGADFQQNFLMSSLAISATAHKGSDYQTRSLKGKHSNSVQSGLESLDLQQTLAQAQQIGEQAIQLIEAPDCPEQVCDLLLAPDHMYIQIHESIGHPLEVDRILGDERNFAGWSFVKPQDFGNLRYGSDLMNITFDPTYQGELASYNFDDGGAPAKKEFLIENGILKRGLGGLESQSRSSIPGVANFRSSGWNRAPIDRMGNINMEPGTSSLQDMIAQTENGIYMESNVSWSIDDYRNKFQFGAEYGRLIKNGQLAQVVKTPKYRGSTLPFWAGLKAVGNKHEMEVIGTPHCGKGEPSQVIRVGHAAPPCLFSNVEVFGGGQ